MKLVTVAQMHDIEKEADINGLPYAEMMENAGRGFCNKEHPEGQIPVAD